MIRRPAPSPCESCPYRRDVPSGVWAAEEYAKLLDFDEPTAGQPLGVFLCHRQDGRICAGWAGCHPMEESLGLRIAVSSGALSAKDYAATHDYVSPVPLFGSGREAATHGLREIARPGTAAQRLMDKVTRRRGRKVTR